VAFVAKHARGGLVDPIAGTGYWAYLLAQVGVDVVCYDLNPGTALVTNTWHGADLYAGVDVKDGAAAVTLPSLEPLDGIQVNFKSCGGDET
jgi:hypothetical protein